MMRSLFAAVSGLRLHQIRMDVVGNNIANVNTPGFKSSRAVFAELFAQTLRGASAPTTTAGGSDAAQVGLGVELAGIDPDMGQGSIQVTGRSTDLAISGNGMFVLKDASGNQVYSRLGAFSLDANGNLVNPQGLQVQGWVATNGTFGPLNASTMTGVKIAVGATKPPTATANVSYGGNLQAGLAAPANVQVPVTVYDSLGNPWTVTVTFTPSGTPNSWNWSVAAPPAGISGSGTVTFTTSGAFSASTGGPITFTPTGAAPVSITPNFSQMTQYAQPSTATAISQDGAAAGALNTITIDKNGVITGSYSNGQTQALAQVALASFANPGGLLRSGDSLYLQSNNSGLPQIGAANTGGRGAIAPGSLEMSNVDLAEQLTEMITTERGFQANARVIGAADQMLQQLATLGQGG